MIPVKHTGARPLREERDLAEGIGQAPAPATALVPNPVLFMVIGSCRTPVPAMNYEFMAATNDQFVADCSDHHTPN